MKKKSKYYDIRTMMQAYPDAKYYMAIGERSNGKTYAWKELCLDTYINTGEKGGNSCDSPFFIVNYT